MRGRLRLASGLVLATYVTTHLLNHALGLMSLAAMEAGRAWFLLLWRSPLGTLVFYGALLTHVTNALVALYARRTLRMPAWEATQLALGLSIPPLLAAHFVGTRLTWQLFGVDDSYARVLTVLWLLAPEAGQRQVLVVAVAWTHACIGLHYWLRLRAWYRRIVAPALSLAVLLPVVASLGFVAAGREAAALARAPAMQERMLWAGRAPLAPAERAALDAARQRIVAVYGVALAGVLVARLVRSVRARARRRVRLTYPGGRVVTIERGLSVLEASRLAGIPHASVCGGRGRCSTCRVRVRGAPDATLAPNDAEARLLRRLALPPDVRLACQLRPVGDLAVTPLLRLVSAARAGSGTTAPAGREQDVAVLFADLRGFTRIAERKLPYDVVFLLNRYFEVVGGAVERAGGVANQFAGDGVMALFGIATSAEDGCARALVAAREMVRGVAELGRTLAEDVREPLRIGIGIHVGPAVVGTMGYGGSTYLTAVGDTVHVAARLEALTKEYDCQLVVSEAAVTAAGLRVAELPALDLTLRNRREPLRVHVVKDIEVLAPAAAL